MEGYSEELLNNSWFRCWGSYTEKGQILKDTLIWKYNEPTRFYHNESHLIGMINEFKKIKDYLEYPREFEISIWVHDLINDIGQNNNESRSCMYFFNLIDHLGLNFNWNDHIVVDNVMATKHIGGGVITSNDAKYIHDIDLITFSSDREDFRRYCQKIRKECFFVDDKTYFIEVIKLFQIFLSRPKIYLSEYYHNSFEDMARENLLKEVWRMKSLLTSSL